MLDFENKYLELTAIRLPEKRRKDRIVEQIVDLI